MANENFQKTFSSNGNRKIWTWSAWIKRYSLGSDQYIFEGYSTDTNRTFLRFPSDDTLVFSVTSNDWLQTSAKFRDVTQTYHIVVRFDTTQSTNTERVKIYVNGIQQSLSATNGTGWPSQNTDYYMSGATSHTIGRWNGGIYLKGIMSDAFFVDGQSLTPSYFGKTNPTGQWTPKHPDAIKTLVNSSGGFGTNGYYLPFGSNLGYDQSGLGNNWIANNFDLNHDFLSKDTISNNFCTLNNLTFFGSRTLSDGGLLMSGGNDGIGTIGVRTGKWYWEMKRNNTGVTPHTGICATWGNIGENWLIQNAGTMEIRNDYGDSVNNAVFLGYYGISNISSELGTRANWDSGDILSFHLDLDSSPRSFKIYKNSSTGTPIMHRTFDYDPTAPSTEDIFPYCRNNAGADTFFNFGQGLFVTSNSNAGYQDSNGKGIFQYQPPSGFLALCEDNIADNVSPAAKEPWKYFTSIKHSGTGTTPTTLDPFGSYGGTLDFNIIKTINSTSTWYWYDRVRGSDKAIYSSNNYIEEYSGLAPYTDQAFTTTGRTIAQTSSGGNEVNFSGLDYINYCWRAGGEPVTNTSGTRTSQVSANQDAGFSIVKFSIASASGEDTIGHGLGSKPDAIIMKCLNNSYNWDVWHKGMGSITNTLILNDGSSGSFSNRQPFTASTEPTSSVFSIRNAFYTANSEFVAYLFKSIPGYSKFCYFAGSGSDPGAYVHLGFRPKVILVRPFGAANNWSFFDSTIDTYNNMGTLLRPNMTDGYLSSPPRIDFLANGFKAYTAGLGNDATGNIVFAWAENPFEFANAR